MVTRVASDIELIVLNWLDKRKINYQFQTSLAGGRFELGGSVIDILLPDRMLAWRIFGEYFHRGVVKEGTDLIQKENLAAMGLTVIDIWGDDVKDRLEQTMRLALRGEEVLR